MRYFIVAIVVLCSLTGMAQEMLRGNVYDPSHTALAGAAIVMLNGADSTYIQGVVSGENGSFSIARPQKEFILAASYLGYETTYMKPTGDSVVTIVLKEATSQLQGVTVRASRPVSQLTRDGFMFTVKGTPLARSGTLNEILEQMPLVKKTSSGYEVMGKERLFSI